MAEETVFAQLRHLDPSKNPSPDPRFPDDPYFVATGPTNALPTTGTVVGTWGYHAGVDGTETMSGSKKVLSITATAIGAAASFTIDGGDTITIPFASSTSSSITIEPKGNLVDPEIIFTSTTSYFIEYVE